MKYEIWGGNLPAVTITLAQYEQLYTQSGCMTWMTDGITMETNMQGGFLKGLGRMFSGNSLFMATFTAQREGESITLAASLPGEIRVFDLQPGYEIIAQKGAFLGAQTSVEVSAGLPTGGLSGMFGGEGFVLQRLSGDGLVFVELDGSIQELDLLPGQTIRVDTGNVAAFEGSVSYNIERVKGFKNILFGGEGLFLTTLTGPGRVWLQTMTAQDLASRVIPFIPTSSD